MNIQFDPLILKTPQLTPTVAAKESPTGTFQQAMAQASSESSKVASAAKQFEALIMGQVLRTARESSDGGWLGSDGDQTGELALEMAEQEFAKALSAKGGLGIAKLVTTSFERHPAKTASSVPIPSSAPASSNTDSAR